MWRYYIDFLTMPLAGLLIGLCASLSWPMVILGYVGWVFLEYSLHRVLFHRQYRREHWRHHLTPQNKEASVPWWASHLTLAGFVLLNPSFALGLLTGYITYLYAHHGMHYSWFSHNGLFGGALRRHEDHHSGNERNFNFLVPLGDLVFGTYKKIPAGLHTDRTG